MTDRAPIVNSVVLNTTDLERATRFWATLLGTEVRREIPDFFTWLRPQRKGGIQVALQTVESIPAVDNAVHLDLGADDLEATHARIVDLGGSHVATHRFESFEWRIMADPDGHHFCIAREDEH